jgi:hypothetical protein
VAAELASQAGEVVQLAREALSNVSRHAEATTCRVSLYRAERLGGGPRSTAPPARGTNLRVTLPG